MLYPSCHRQRADKLWGGGRQRSQLGGLLHPAIQRHARLQLRTHTTLEAHTHLRGVVSEGRVHFQHLASDGRVDVAGSLQKQQKQQDAWEQAAAKTLLLALEC